MITLIANNTPSTRYLEEIIGHAGLAWQWKEAGALSPNDRVIVLSGSTALSTAERDRITDLTMAGAALIVSGGTAGLDDLLGASTGSPGEGYVTAPDGSHPVTRGLHSPLHVFHAAPLRAAGGTSLARLSDTSATGSIGDAVIMNRPGAGSTVAISADIAASVLHIQAGIPVHADGAPAPDGSAPIDDGILKAEDGMVLSWEHDRIQTAAGPVADCPGIDPAYPSGDTPWFAIPIADELRMLLLQAIAWAASETGAPLALLDAWPNGREAVGMISHDSDLNIDASAHTTLRLLNEAGITSTWCHMWGPNYEDTYEPGTFGLIQEAGHEFALHYNAFDQDGGTWGREHLAWQANFVRNEAGVDGFVSNKNHYTRWEGGVEFFHWLVEEGIQVDQSRGPSKKGSVGYPLGTSLPTKPWNPESGEFIDVLELPMQFQDLWLTAPAYMAATTMQQAKRHRGVAHFLFHQNHLHARPEVADAFLALISEGRDAGLAWWTCERINDWERLRRKVRVTIDGNLVRIQSPEAIADATITIVLPRGVTPGALRIRGAELESGTRWNLPAVTLHLDLDAGETVLTMERDVRG